jgi:hypothetical protein
MASFFNLTLDTTAPGSPSIEIAGGAGSTSTQVNATAISTSDGDTTGYQMKLWGDVDLVYDSNVQATELGTQQVETAVVSETGGVVAGDVTVTITGANVGNSPKAIVVAVATSDTASQVAGKIRTALNGETDITTNYTVGGADANVSLTRKIAVANDATLNIEIDGGTTNVNDLATSTNTTAGVLSSSWITYDTSKNIKLSLGDGTKTIYLKIRDDVGNETTYVSDSISLDSTSPVVAIMSGPTPNKISKVATYDTSAIEWQTDEAFVEYKIKVVPTTGSDNTTGTLVGTSNGSSNTSGSAGNYPASENITTNIKGADLEAASAGDGTKIVKVFVKDATGNWSI